MRWAIAAVLLLSALGASRAHAQPVPDGEITFAFLADYDANDAATREADKALLRATAAGLDTANFALLTRKSVPLYCVTQTVNAAQALYFLRLELNLNPTVGNVAWPLVLVSALARAYPCPAGKAS